MSLYGPSGRMEEEVREDAGLDVVFGWESGVGGEGLGGFCDGEVDIEREWKRKGAVVGDSMIRSSGTG